MYPSDMFEQILRKKQRPYPLPAPGGPVDVGINSPGFEGSLPEPGVDNMKLLSTRQPTRSMAFTAPGAYPTRPQPTIMPLLEALMKATKRPMPVAKPPRFDRTAALDAMMTTKRRRFHGR